MNSRKSMFALSIGFGTILAVGCSSTPPRSMAVEKAPSVGDVYIVPIAPDVWVHTTYMSLPDWGTFPSNGLIVRGNSGCIIIDTGCSPKDMAFICDWAEKAIGPVLGAVVTHWHNDCIGGIDEAHSRGIQTIALEETRSLAMGKGISAPQIGFESLYNLEPFGIDGECFFPGAGHSSDNIVVWLENSQVLFGGCLVRPGNARGLGNLSDADIEQWPNSMSTLMQRYPDVQIVVPGHLETGDAGLLEHTYMLTSSHAETMPSNKQQSDANDK